MTSSGDFPAESVRPHEILEQVRKGFVSVLSHSLKGYHATAGDVCFSDETGDSTVMFVKDDLQPRPEDVSKWVSTLKEDGSWPDIRYISKTLSCFPAIEHLRRIRAMARVSTEGAIGVAAHRALGYWLTNPPASASWWWTEIGVPLQLGAVLVLLEHVLGSDVLERGVGLLDVCRIQRSGQNRVWLAACVLMRAVLRRDIESALSARDALVDELSVRSEGDGLQPDGSYHLHGRQPQFGNYGLSFALEMSRIAEVFKGTDWAFSDEQLDLLESFVRRGMLPVVWRDRMDLASIGRQLNRDASRMKAVAVSAVVDCLERVRGRALSAVVPEGLVWYDRSACGVYRAGGWMCSFKCETASVQGTEHCNEDNPEGAHLADGAIYMYATGREYDDVYLYWDWAHIPGVTAYEPDAVGWPPRNSSDDLTVDGRTVRFALTRDGLSVRKEVRFSAEGVDVGVSEITSSDPRAVVTTVEQCRACDNASVGFAGERLVAVNGSFRYDLPSNASVQIRHGVAPDAEGDLFEIVIRHGVAPKNASCRWRVRYLTAEQAAEEAAGLCKLGRPAADGLRVLVVSNGNPDAPNPFVPLTIRELRNRGLDVDSGVERFFAGAEEYDIVQFEWPEDLVRWRLDTITASQLDEIEARIRRLKRFGVVLTYTRHNSRPHTRTSALTERLYRIVEENVDAVFHMGEFSRSELQASRPAEQKTVDYIVPHHLPTSVYDPHERSVSRKALGIDPEAEVVVAFGAFRNADEVRLTEAAFAGCSSARKVLLAPRMKDNAARTDHQTLALMLSAADVVFVQRISILNSGNLPLGFMYGKVVVGPRCGNVGEILEATGNPTFDPTDCEAAAKALDRGLELAHDGKGEENRSYAFARWRPDQIAELMEDAYLRLLEGRTETCVSRDDVRALLRDMTTSNDVQAVSQRRWKEVCGLAEKRKLERDAAVEQAAKVRELAEKRKRDRAAAVEQAAKVRELAEKRKRDRDAAVEQAAKVRELAEKRKLERDAVVEQSAKVRELSEKRKLERDAAVEQTAKIRELAEKRKRDRDAAVEQAVKIRELAEKRKVQRDSLTKELADCRESLKKSRNACRTLERKLADIGMMLRGEQGE